MLVLNLIFCKNVVGISVSHVEHKESMKGLLDIFEGLGDVGLFEIHEISEFAERNIPGKLILIILANPFAINVVLHA